MAGSKDPVAYPQGVYLCIRQQTGTASHTPGEPMSIRTTEQFMRPDDTPVVQVGGAGRGPRLSRRRLTGSLAIAPLLLAACTNDADEVRPSTDQGGGGNEGAGQDEFLGAHGLDGMDARAIIEHLEALPLEERPQDLMASVRPSQLILTDAEGTEVTLPIEGDFYLSTAPFVEDTHECWFHSLTTCRGELAEVDVEVTLTDLASGEVIHEGIERTHPNGFFGLWLPRGGTYQITCTVDGATSTTEVSTSDEEDATCLTTMQLT